MARLVVVQLFTRLQFRVYVYCMSADIIELINPKSCILVLSREAKMTD